MGGLSRFGRARGNRSLIFDEISGVCSTSAEIADGAYEVLSSPFFPPGPVLPVLSSDRLHVGDAILTYSRTFAMLLTFAARAVGAPVITLAAATLAFGWAHASAKVGSLVTTSAW